MGVTFSGPHVVPVVLLTPIYYGATGNGTTDDAVALQLALSSGKRVFLDRTYACGSRVSATRDGGGFWSDGSGGIVMLTSTGKFTNTASVDRYNSNSCLLYVSGYDNVSFEGFTITLGGTPADDNQCIAIGIRSSVGSSVTGCDISGFRKSGGMISVDSSTDIDIKNNKLHDGICKGATLGQLTGIAVDDNLVGGVYSERINITNNKIYNLTVDATFLAANDYQTDGITVAKTETRAVIITGNNIENVGEGVDCFGFKCVISDNDIYAAFIFGVKLIHGATGCIVSDNAIDYVGLAGVVVSGSTSADDTDNNTIDNNNISRVNPEVDADSPWVGLVSIGDGPWDSSGSTTGLRCTAGPSSDATNNTFSNNKVFNSPNAHYGISALQVGGNNKWLDYDLSGTFLTAPIENSSVGDYFRNAKRSMVRAYRSTSQAVPTGSAAIIVYDVETLDTNGEYDTATGIYTAKTPQRVTVTGRARTAAGTAGNVWVLRIACPTQTCELPMRSPSTAEFGVQISTSVLDLDVGSTVSITLQHAKGSDETISGGTDSAVTNLQIAEL